MERIEISLFYIASPRLGGWVTYTTHLIRSLRQFNEQHPELGFDFKLYKIANRDEKRTRKFAEDIEYQNVSPQTAIRKATINPTIVLALDKRFYDIGFPVLKEAKNIVIHDTTEINAKFKEFATQNGVRAIAIRDVLNRHLLAAGVDSTFIRHPYVRYPKPDVTAKSWYAVATSRIDWDKYTHFIFGANALLPEHKRVRVYGAENRLYTHNKITPFFPDWRKQYYGRFECSKAIEFAARSEFVVDLTEIKNDGGGTQYTFLEAFDAGATLIVNKNWFRYTDGCLIPGSNCLTAESAQELANLLSGTIVDHDLLRANGESLLCAHSPDKVVPSYLDRIFV